MATDNESDFAVSNQNKINGDLQDVLSDLTAALVLLDSRMPVNATFDTAVTTTTTQIGIMAAQIDVEFPVVKLTSDET